MSPTSRPDVNKMAVNAARDNGVGPVQDRLRHLIQINSEVASVIAMATESIWYIYPHLIKRRVAV